MSLTLHFIFACCPHLNPIERLWGVMRKHLTHNKSYATYREFAEAALNFLREKVPKNWPKFRRLSARTTTSASANSPSNW